MNPHQARIARKKLQKKTNENHFLDAIFFRDFSVAIFCRSFTNNILGLVINLLIF